jgi:hypothetical protein
MDQILAKLRLYLPLARPFWPHMTALFVFGLLGWTNGYFQASKPAANPGINDTWSIPAWTAYRAGPERLIVAGFDMWDGGKPAVVKAAPTQQGWQLVGTVRTGETYTAIIQLGASGRIQHATSGQTLPNGEKVIAVKNGVMQIDAGGTQQEVKTFDPARLAQTEKK